MFKVVRGLSLGLLASLLLLGNGQAETYTIDAVHSTVDFTIRHLVSRSSGRFDDFSGTVTYDAAHPEKTSAEATIQVGSINTGNEKRDGHLKNPDFFDAETYPTITFKSTSAKKEGDTILLMGEFTMHGTTHSVTLPVTVLGVGAHPRNKAPMAGFESEIVLKRSDYGVNNWTDATGVLGDEVKVRITLETAGPKPE
ncbi:MAG: YceI family protein [bacterium]|nr:YceI family protein [bacterium]